MLPVDEAVALVERVRLSAAEHAARALDVLATAVPAVRVIALRVCPDLPPTVAERIADHRARNVADWVMYRRELAAAAGARGWDVHWFDAKTVLAAAGKAMGVDFEARFAGMRREVGPPWNNDHRLAMAAAIVATGDPRS